MNKTILFIWLSLLSMGLNAQMRVGSDTLYGNEWIDFSKTYYSFKIGQDGIYRIPASTFTAAGFPLNVTPGIQFRLYKNGRQVPVFTSTDGIFGTNDFLEFYGEAGRSELDSFLFDHPEAEMVNPRYGLFSDTAAYFLCADDSGIPLRLTVLDNDLSNPPPKEDYCWFTLEKVFSQARFKRQRTSEISMSWFDGEGFHKGLAAASPVSMAPQKLFTGGPAARATLRYACNLGAHDQRIKIKKGALDTLVQEDQFDDFRVMQHQFQVPQNWLGSQTILTLESANLIDRHALASVSLTYPRLCDASQANVFNFLIDSSSAPKYLEISNFNTTNGLSPIVYVLENNSRLLAAANGSLAKMILPASGQIRHLILANPETGIVTIDHLQALKFRDFSGEDAEFILLSHPAFFADPGQGGTNPVAEYAAYRQSLQGGGYKTTVVSINELYDQFAYGAPFHPLAIRNFAHWVKKHWSNPRFMFIIGKGLHYDVMRDPSTASVLADSIFYVPVFGNPGVDQLFVTGNAGASPIFPVGRLAAVKASDVSDYLEKVKAFEANNHLAQTAKDRLWMKKIIHLSGGNSNDAPVIRSTMDHMRSIAMQGRMGADVATFYKTTNSPVQVSTLDQIVSRVNDGVGLLTLMGHSSVQVVDFDMGAPADYNNHDRYPFLFTMGCFSGQCAALNRSLGEDFTLARDRGAIGFMAFANYGLLETLRIYGEKFYEKTGTSEYGKTIGEQLAETAKSLENNGDLGMEAALHQLVLQGDPALKMYAAPGPDYVVDPDSVAFTPNPVPVEQGSYSLDLSVANLGENTAGNLVLRILRQAPNDTASLLLRDTIPAPANRQKLHYTFPAPDRNAVGYNHFRVELDPDNVVAEFPQPSAESNNQLLGFNQMPGVEVYFFADDVQPVFPAPFGIVGQTILSLKASTYTLAATNRRFLFQIDTTPRFNSPVLQTGQVYQPGGLISWTPPVALSPNHVCFWRVARDSLVGGNIPWRNRSFLLEPGTGPGWNQSHPLQFTDNRLSNIRIDSLSGHWDFVDNAAFASIRVDWLSPNRQPGVQNSFYEGLSGYGAFVSKQIKRGVIVALLDPLTGRFQQNPIGSPTNPSPLIALPFHYFDLNDSLKRIALMDFLGQQVGHGWYVAILGLKNPAQDSLGFAAEKWAQDSISSGTNLFQVFEQHGAKHLRALQNLGSKPFGFIYRQGYPDFPAVDTILTDPNGNVELRRNFPAKWPDGEMQTVEIGPAQSWGSLHWAHAAPDAPDETLRLSIYGLRAGIPDTLLYVLENEIDISLSDIPANVFPSIKLQLNARDTALRTLPQIGQLKVLYTPLPELAFAPANGFFFHADTLDEGDQASARLVFENVGQTPVDSLELRYRVEDQKGFSFERLEKVKNLLPGDTVWAHWQWNTGMHSGAHLLSIEANPENRPAEQAHFNNIFQRSFYIRTDRTNPLLDVTFDGLHILNGDLVSAKPEIIATLRDENRFQRMQDTSSFILTLTYPDYNVEKIAWNDPRVLFIPASSGSGKNVAQLEFRPVFLIDGVYKLQVNGRDAAGNNSGLDYQISFEVITKSSLGQFLNYPNPFSSSTCFVYTLTGSETPAQFKLQIMTVSGKVVREVTAAEFGPLQVGTHISQFCWDGTDTYGDRLANGVYLYRIFARKADGSPFELWDNPSIDAYFKNGLGKMVLMR